jgi:hypothetical protein
VALLGGALGSIIFNNTVLLLDVASRCWSTKNEKKERKEKQKKTKYKYKKE